MRKIEISREVLEDLYTKQRLGIPQIAKVLGIGKTTVHRKLIENNISIRSIGEATRSPDWTGYCKNCNKPSENKTRCKSCSDKVDYRKHYLSRKIKSKLYRDRPENKKHFSEYYKIYVQQHKDRINEIKSKYTKTNPQAIIRHRIRERFRRAIRKVESNSNMSLSLYGIMVKDIVTRLGPCPGKKEDWHIDHKIPISLFDLRDPSQVKKAFAPENHQWLPKDINLKKHNKMEGVY